MRRTPIRDVRRGDVIKFYAHGGTYEKAVREVVRAADEIPALHTAVVKARSRPKMRDACEALLAALSTVESYGREARIVRFYGTGEREFAIDDDVMVPRLARPEEMVECSR